MVWHNTHAHRMLELGGRLKPQVCVRTSERKMGILKWAGYKTFMMNLVLCYSMFMLMSLLAWTRLYQTQTSGLLVKLALQGDLAGEIVRLEPKTQLQKFSNRTNSVNVQNRVVLSHEPKEFYENADSRHKTQYKNGTGTTSGRMVQPQPSKPVTKKCVRSATGSKWFRSRFKPKTKMFLDKDDVKEFAKYSQKILPFGLKNQNLTALAEILQHKNFTNPPVYGPGGRGQRCLRCAVVGSGGILNGSGVGREIDSHDYVFRLNQGLASRRFDKDIGRRTTFYTFYPESQNINRNDSGSVLAFYVMFRPYDVLYALKILNQENFTNFVSKVNKNETRSSDVNPYKLKIIHPAFFFYVHREFFNNKARPTTGVLVTFLALHICDEVSVYGFGYDPRFSLHFYDKTFVKHKNSLTYPHNVKTERTLWKKLHEEGVIKLYKRNL